MRHLSRILIFIILIFSKCSYALEPFIEGLAWRPTETNNWAYVNSETLPQQTLGYKTIHFNYSPGFRIGVNYVGLWDAMLSYTRLYTRTNDSAYGNIQPAFVGSVTAKPSHAYLYQSGHVTQSIDYNMFTLNLGKRFYVADPLMIHPILGLMGGWINQSIHAQYQGSTSANERLFNDFSGVGPEVGVDTSICLFNYNGLKPLLFAAFASSYLLGHWNINDTTLATPTQKINVNGAKPTMGALTLQGSLGVKLEYNKFAVKLAYEINDWFNQIQYFDNDTGTHNNDVVLQGATLGVSYSV